MSRRINKAVGVSVAVVLPFLLLSHQQQAAAAFAPPLLLLSRTSSTTNVGFASRAEPSRSSRHHRQPVILLSTTVQAPPSSSSSPSKKQEDGGDDDATSSPLDTPKVEKESFDWFQQWYPLVPVEILNPEVPHKFQLLGQDIVVWNDGTFGDEEYARKTKSKKKSKAKKKASGRRNGTWRAFADECPHRKVPLSEGRVENDGTLLCSYHGWRFAGDTGNCVSVPQVMDAPTEHERIIKNTRTSCQSHPTRVVDGVLYVWASRDENASIQAALTPVTLNYKLPGQCDDDSSSDESKIEKDRVWTGPWNYRELPYGADFFLENLVDPSHVPVSHHNIVGNRYGDLTTRVENFESLSKSGFTIEVSAPTSTLNSTTKFIAPGAVHIEVPIEGASKGALQVLELLVSPGRPGFCNHVGRMVIIKGEVEAGSKDAKKQGNLLRQFTLPLPKWLNHIMASGFLNQDALFLHHQERKMHESGQYSSVGSYYLDADQSSGSSKDDPASYSKAVYPVRTDRGVLNFRNWLARYTPRGGKIPYMLHNPTMPPADNAVVFDVWNAHTKHCSYCQDALRRLKKIRFATIAMALCLAVLRPFGKVSSLVATLSTAGIAYVLHKLIGMFYKYEFSHAQND
jgi:phenylpropionate dioxygenase-like ring-hydroxylating dioxygenase large terminal subunit